MQTKLYDHEVSHGWGKLCLPRNLPIDYSIHIYLIILIFNKTRTKIKKNQKILNNTPVSYKNFGAKFQKPNATW